MPAYVVLEKNENTGGVIFAKDKRTALKIGANQFADGEAEYCNITRRRDLDQYEGKGVPAALLVDEGWYFECHGCGLRLHSDLLEEERLPVSGIVGIEGSAIFCCHTCRTEHMAREARANAFGEGFKAMLRDLVTTRFGQVEFLPEGQWRHHVYVPRGHEPLVVKEAKVAFNFPGQQFGPACIEYRHEGLHGARLMGPVKPHFTCCGGDRKAFEAWAVALEGGEA